ncbi:hypothetical protein RUE5091_02959 [Ruegeria denitrificans]|uniref:Sulfotransferase domain protein n=1 Tax=Ruegeria denitrificans TaxID=1715692 RepID=A0A0P1IK36_9RHOB|nr:sulfotransferase [Ruegeria denitrificans]CUK07532.1 hypothetical protein RUE5091_02959 [Ruegeria denitrificans]
MACVLYMAGMRQRCCDFGQDLSQGSIDIGTARPIFVIGLPRSGTTLVERILAQHSTVQGLGEFASIHQGIRQIEAQPSASRAAPKLAEY